MKCKTTANGKTIFDIRNQYRRIRDYILYRGVMRRKAMVERKEITTMAQWNADIDKENEKLNRLYDIAHDMVFELYKGAFQIA